MIRHFHLYATPFLWLFLTSCSEGENMPVSQEPPKVMESPSKLTNEDWKKILTPEQFRVTREAGTERPFGTIYDQFKKQGKGAYHCVCCNSKLFSSNEKFDSHCGWPSFYDPAKLDSVKTRDDFSGGMKRTEVLCAKCDAHLGHLFTGEGFQTPKDQRFCINGVALKFVPDPPQKK